MVTLSPRQAAATNRKKLTFWWKDTQVNFKNNTYDPITFQPINDSVGRWKAFTLQPGQEKSIVDSIWGRTNTYDIYWKVTDGDKLIGEFFATNYSMQNALLKAGTDDLYQFKTSLNRERYGYNAGYFNRPKVEEGEIGKKDKFGKINTNNLVKKRSIDGDYGPQSLWGYTYYTDNPGWNAFLPGEPVAIVSYLGDGNGNKTFSFAIAKEGTPQAVI